MRAEGGRGDSLPAGRRGSAPAADHAADHADCRACGSTSLAVRTISATPSNSSSQCQAIGNFPKGWFYYYGAEYGTDAFEWAGDDAKVCIERIGQVERMHTKTQICTGKYLRGFHAAQVDYPSVTWNLDP